jgi:large subunit ribosomal protein L30e
MPISEIKNNLKNKRLVLGTGLTVKQLKRGNISKVFLSSNCPESVKKDVAHYSQVAGVEVEDLGIPNTELGTVCKKPFSVSIVGLIKQ